MQKKYNMYRIEEVVISPVKLNPELINKISLKRNLSKEEVKKMLTYNIITVKQLCLLTGASPGKIESKLRPRSIGNQILNEFPVAYPFPEIRGKKGFRFVIRDENVENFLMNENQ